MGGILFHRIGCLYEWGKERFGFFDERLRYNLLKNEACEKSGKNCRAGRVNCALKRMILVYSLSKNIEWKWYMFLIRKKG